MRKYIYIGCGSFFGAILRFLVKKGALTVLFINVIGAFIIALLLTIAYEVWDVNSDLRLGLTTGFLGSFTTFSTLCKETVGFIQKGNYFSAISYVTVSVMLGIGAAYFGIVLARVIGSRMNVRRERNSSKESEMI